MARAMNAGYEDVELHGEVAGYEVRRLLDPDGNRMVGISFPGDEVDLYTAFSGSDALRIAQWLRIAAARGKTLAQARVNARKPPPSAVEAQGPGTSQGPKL
jgi:hypothetical protein